MRSSQPLAPPRKKTLLVMLLGASHFFSQFTLRLRGGCWLHSYHAHSNIWLLSLFHFHLGIFLHVHTRRSTRTSPVSPFSIVDAQLTSTINRMLLQRCTPSIVFGNLKTHIVGLPLFFTLDYDSKSEYLTKALVLVSTCQFIQVYVNPIHHMIFTHRISTHSTIIF